MGPTEQSLNSACQSAPPACRGMRRHDSSAAEFTGVNRPGIPRGLGTSRMRALLSPLPSLSTLHIRSLHHCQPQLLSRYPLKTARAWSQTAVQENSLVGEDRVHEGFEAR